LGHSFSHAFEGTAAFTGFLDFAIRLTPSIRFSSACWREHWGWIPDDEYEVCPQIGHFTRERGVINGGGFRLMRRPLQLELAKQVVPPRRLTAKNVSPISLQFEIGTIGSLAGLIFNDSPLEVASMT